MGVNIGGPNLYNGVGNMLLYLFSEESCRWWVVHRSMDTWLPISLQQGRQYSTVDRTQMVELHLRWSERYAQGLLLPSSGSGQGTGWSEDEGFPS